jgi:hypothetical protein
MTTGLVRARKVKDTSNNIDVMLVLLADLDLLLLLRDT